MPLVQISCQHFVPIAQARWLQQAQQGDFDIDDDGDDDAFLSSADDGPPGKQLQQSTWSNFSYLPFALQIRVPSSHMISLYECTSASLHRLVVLHPACMVLMPMLVIDNSVHPCIAPMIPWCSVNMTNLRP